MTGGGRPAPPPPSTGADRMIEGILGPALAELDNEYDSDALLDINNNNWKWESWTPKSLIRPISDTLKPSNGSKQIINQNSWLKRRRPDQRNLNDQLIEEKIKWVKLLAENAREESRMMILEEQLKQEKIKTQKLL